MKYPYKKKEEKVIKETKEEAIEKPQNKRKSKRIQQPDPSGDQDLSV